MTEGTGDSFIYEKQEINEQRNKIFSRGTGRRDDASAVGGYGR
jgi:hypothetical protein